MQRLAPPQRRLAIGLAALAGFVDGVGFLTAGGYFVSFMSGNTTAARRSTSATDPATRDRSRLLILGLHRGVLLAALSSR